MGYAPPLASSTRYESLGASIGQGTAITASGTANTKGAYAALGTSGFDYDGLIVAAGDVHGSNIYRYRIDIAVNTGGSDQVIVEDLYFDGDGGAYYTSLGGSVQIPLAVPKGAAIKARCQSPTASATVAVWVQGMQGDARMTRGFRALKSATDWTNSDPTNGLTLSGTTQSGWTQVMAATPSRFAGLYLGLDGAGAPPAWIEAILDVGWGTAGSERVLCQCPIKQYLATTFGIQLVQPSGPFPCDLPAGTRLAVRGQSAYAGANGTAYPVLHGLAA